MFLDESEQSDQTIQQDVLEQYVIPSHDLKSMIRTRKSDDRLPYNKKVTAGYLLLYGDPIEKMRMEKRTREKIKENQQEDHTLKGR